MIVPGGRGGLHGYKFVAACNIAMAGKVRKSGKTVWIVVLYWKERQCTYRLDSDGNVLGYVRADKLSQPSR